MSRLYPRQSGCGRNAFVIIVAWQTSGNHAQQVWRRVSGSSVRVGSHVQQGDFNHVQSVGIHVQPRFASGPASPAHFQRYRRGADASLQSSL